MQPWMKKSIAEVEELLGRKMAQHTEQKVVKFHQSFDKFELRVLARQALQWM